MVLVLLMMMAMGLILGFVTAAWMVRDTDKKRREGSEPIRRPPSAYRKH